MFDLTTQRMPRTNNIAEGFHNKMKKIFGCSHPSIFKFLDSIRDIQAQTELDIVHNSTGVPATSQRVKYTDFDRRLFNVVKQRDDYEDAVSYVDALAHLVTF